MTVKVRILFFLCVSVVRNTPPKNYLPEVAENSVKTKNCSAGLKFSRKKAERPKYEKVQWDHDDTPNIRSNLTAKAVHI